MIDYKALAIIPARAGSVGIKNKNIKSFNGFPLFIWSVAAAIESSYVDQIVICSDHDNIPDLLEKASISDSRIKCIGRPEHISTSDSTTESCLIHVLNSLNHKFEYVVTLQPTSPLRSSKIIDRALYEMLSSNKETLLSVESCTPFFIQKQANGLKWHFDPLRRKMRQHLTDAELYFHDDGNLYITKVSHLLKTNCRLDIDPYLLVNDPLCSYQIDTLIDFAVLEKIQQEVSSSLNYVNPRDVILRNDETL